MSVQQTTTQNLINRVDSYFALRNTLPIDCSSNNHCNENYMTSDQTLADITNLIVAKVNQGKTYSFGVGMLKFPQGCDLLSRCCSCPSRPNPYTRKNQTRRVADAKLIAWKKYALKWINEGAKEMNPNTITEEQPESGGGIRVRRIGYNLD